jgi:ABC-type proline/glycine betaine transport system ATPase subunit
VADRVVIIDKGAIQQIGTPNEVRDLPANSFVEEFLDLDGSIPA